MHDFDPHKQERWTSWPKVDNLGDVDDQEQWVAEKLRAAVGPELMRDIWRENHELLEGRSMYEVWQYDRQTVIDLVNWLYT